MDSDSDSSSTESSDDPPPPPMHFGRLTFVAWTSALRRTVVGELPLLLNARGEWSCGAASVSLLPTHQVVRMEFYRLGKHEATFVVTNTDLCLGAQDCGALRVHAVAERPYVASMLVAYSDAPSFDVSAVRVSS